MRFGATDEEIENFIIPRRYGATDEEINEFCIKYEIIR